ncbi:hypothetical protein H8356DRAFT_1429776 [Neocallimastix lanati (nom. inval.)]|nr:hypothetical protein H8356DRAFT_1429776 [Neocallimastix sp. JGI-2020a]
MCCKNGIQIQSFNHIVHINNICRNTAKFLQKYFKILSFIYNHHSFEIYINNMVFIIKYMQKYYDFKLRKHTKNPLRNAAHGDKRENRAWNPVELRRFVEISRDNTNYHITKDNHNDTLSVK